MIGTKYTPELLAALAKTPHLRSLAIKATQDGQTIMSYTRRYIYERKCETTFFDVGDAELLHMIADVDADGMRFGFALGCDVEKVSVSSRPGGLSVSFITSRWPEEGLDKRSVDLSAAASVEFKSEVGAVSMIEETHIGVDTITSFFEEETSYEPWLVIVEPC